MPIALRGAIPHTHDKTALLCQCVAGHCLAVGDIPAAARLLTTLAELSEDAWLPTKVGAKSSTPDPLTHFWFAQASYAFLRASKDQETWSQKLLPVIKRAAQGMISGLFEGTTMSDGGMLLGTKDDSMFVNALWYNTMGILAEQLPLAGDRAGDHFERLASRFRRSYIKAYWCDQHACLCDTLVRTQEEHNAADYLPPPAQAVNATLPFSAIPRTKQRQAIDAVRKNAQRPMGVLVGGATESYAMAHQGHVSPLMLVWLAEGHVRTSDTPATSVAEAIAWLAPLADWLHRTAILPEVFTADVTAEPGKPHAPTMAETTRVWRWLKDASEKPLGNSKRTRITG